MHGTTHEDAERLAKRFHEVTCMVVPYQEQRWDDLRADYRELLVEVFDEMLRAQLLFPGASLYADPSV
jgi:hypothetical protein